MIPVHTIYIICIMIMYPHPHNNYVPYLTGVDPAGNFRGGPCPTPAMLIFFQRVLGGYISHVF
jgi:hypothetical protein